MKNLIHVSVREKCKISLLTYEDKQITCSKLSGLAFHYNHFSTITNTNEVSTWSNETVNKLTHDLLAIIQNKSFYNHLLATPAIFHPEFHTRASELVWPMVAQYSCCWSVTFSRYPGLTNAKFWIPKKGVWNCSFESCHYLFNVTVLFFRISEVLYCYLIDRRSNYTFWSRGFPFLAIASTAAEKAAAVPNPVGGFVRWVRWCDALPRLSAVEGTFRSARISKLN